jgi:hypothetical protein
MAADLLPDDHPMRHLPLTLTQVEAILRADGVRASTDMAVGRPTQRALVVRSLLLKG